jgi:two-component system chemotaxis response regulator CheY
MIGTLMTIMIVDDNPFLREIVRESFPASETFAECSDGKQAVERYGEMHPDWVIMDVRMEPMDGFEALSSIRAADPAARVIMMSQFADPMYRARALYLGAVDFVSKVELGRLPEIVRSAESG